MGVRAAGEVHLRLRLAHVRVGRAGAAGAVAGPGRRRRRQGVAAQSHLPGRPAHEKNRGGGGRQAVPPRGHQLRHHGVRGHRHGAGDGAGRLPRRADGAGGAGSGGARGGRAAAGGGAGPDRRAPGPQPRPARALRRQRGGHAPRLHAGRLVPHGRRGLLPARRPDRAPGPALGRHHPRGLPVLPGLAGDAATAGTRGAGRLRGARARPRAAPRDLRLRGARGVPSRRGRGGLAEDVRRFVDAHPGRGGPAHGPQVLRLPAGASFDCHRQNQPQGRVRAGAKTAGVVELRCGGHYGCYGSMALI